MSQPDQPKTVVLALGNLIRSDDGIAIYALQHLEKDSRVPSSVSLIEGGTKGIELVSHIFNASRLLVLDAVDVGAPAGTVLRLEGKDLRAMPGNGSVHELALADILNALRLLAQEPRETVLLGVQPATTELGTSLSAAAQKALPVLLEAAVVELARWAGTEPCEASELAKNEVAVSAVISGLVH
jgi:hydrogenase maturation protease